MSQLLPVTIIQPTPEKPAQQGREAGEERNVILLVGVDQFGRGLSPLSGAVRDMSALYVELSRSKRYPNTHVTLLTNPTKQTFRRALDDWIAQVSRAPECKGTIYFSTHGFYAQHMYHLCMSNTQLEGGDLYDAVNWHELRQWLAPVREHAVLLLLDTCRRVLSGQKNIKSMLPQQRDDISLHGEHWAVWTAASFGEFAQETASTTECGGPAGLFSRCLLKMLQTPVQRTHEWTLEGLYERVKRSFEQEAEALSYPFSQSPRLYIGQIECGRSTFFHTVDESGRSRFGMWMVGLSLSLLLGLFLYIGRLAWSDQSPRQPMLSCQTCVVAHWRRLRAQDCQATVSVGRRCSLPCNYANMKQVAVTCEVACRKRPDTLRKSFLRESKALSKYASVSASLCQKMLPDVLRKR